MQNSMVMFTFSVFNWKCLFEKIGSKKSNCQFELKFRTRLTWIGRIMQKICGVHFFYFRPEKPFLGKSGQKIKTLSLSWNLVPRLIWKWGIQWWWCLLFLFLTINIYLGQILVQIFKIVCSKWNLIQRLIRICKIQWWCLFYLL